LFGLLFQGIALANYATSFYVVLHPHAIKFEPYQQNILIVGNVYGGVAVSFQWYFLSSSYSYDIDDSFF